MTTSAPDYCEIAARVNRRLAEQAKPGTMPEVVSRIQVGRVLDGGIGWTGRGTADLIREIAAEVEKEQTK